ncbi:3 TM domain-containing transmembrane protein [Acrasis kona]|uniref:3 TM domain-containing transmembrane protein n=1 Tax=Acrasis kona TaxID=1008807 RepID=A0AAW2Z9L9_9EUKA
MFVDFVYGIVWTTFIGVCAVFAVVSFILIQYIFNEYTSSRSQHSFILFIYEVPTYALHLITLLYTFIKATLIGKILVLFFVLSVNGFVATHLIALPIIAFLSWIVYEAQSTKKRKIAEEYIDMGPINAGYTLAEYTENMTQIGIISELLGSKFSVLSHAGFSSLSVKPKSILDVGCGAGWLSYALQEKYPDCEITGTEINPDAIHFAKSRCNKNLSKSPNFRLLEHVDLREPDKSYDVVTCSLVTHHIPTDEDIIEFLRRCGKVARSAVIISDLERSAISVVAYQTIIASMFNNRLTKHDGELSIRRSFTEEEWRYYLKKAGYRNDQYVIRWRPVNWFVITIFPSIKT